MGEGCTGCLLKVCLQVAWRWNAQGLRSICRCSVLATDGQKRESCTTHALWRTGENGSEQRVTGSPLPRGWLERWRCSVLSLFGMEKASGQRPRTKWAVGEWRPLLGLSSALLIPSHADQHCRDRPPRELYRTQSASSKASDSYFTTGN